jgi:hypothetical protein
MVGGLDAVSVACSAEQLPLVSTAAHVLPSTLAQASELEVCGANRFR